MRMNLKISALTPCGPLASGLGFTTLPKRKASDLSRRGYVQFFLDVYGREEGDVALKGPCDQAGFLGFLKKANDQVTIFFSPDSDGRPQSDQIGRASCRERV